MPYSTTQELPSEVKSKYTSKQQRAFRKAFNDAVAEGKSEKVAFQIAHAAARRAGDRDATQQKVGHKSKPRSQKASLEVDEGRTFSGDKRKKLAQKGQALKDGSFPIANKSDLRNAIQAYGRASNKAAAKRHIIKRAKALGATNMLPDDWKKNGDSAMSDLAEGIVTKPHKFSPQPDKPSLCAACNKTREAGQHQKKEDKAAKHPSKPHAFAPSENDPAKCAKCGKPKAAGQHQKEDDEDSAASESFHDVMAALRRAVREKVGRRVYLVDAGADWLVYERFDEDDYKFTRQSYTLSNGSVTLGDDATEVLRKTVYVPVSKQDSASGLVEIWGACLATEYAVDRGGR